jgi:hypothetical protein
LRCAPQCGARTIPAGSGGLPVLDESLIDKFGLFCELAFLIGTLFGRGFALGVLGAASCGRAGAEFQCAEFALNDGLAFERVILLGGEQLPAEARELAGGRDDRDLRAAARSDALIERAQRPRGFDRGPGRFAEDVSAVGGPLF